MILSYQLCQVIVASFLLHKSYRWSRPLIYICQFLITEFAGIASLALFHLYTVAEVSAEIPELDGFIKKSWTKVCRAII